MSFLRSLLCMVGLAAAMPQPPAPRRLLMVKTASAGKSAIIRQPKPRRPRPFYGTAAFYHRGASRRSPNLSQPKRRLMARRLNLHG